MITKTRQKADRKNQEEQEAAYRGKKKELKAVEADIEHLENEIADYEAQMCQNDFYDDLNNVNAVTAAYNTAREAVASLTERWEELLLEIEEWEEQ